MTGLNPGHIAGLRRLSARAASVPTTSAPSSLPVRNGLLSFSSLVDKVINHLRNSGIQSLFRSSESDPQVLKKQRSVSEKSAGSSTVFSRRSLDAGGRTPRSKVPGWVEEYIGQIGSVLKAGGWSESDVSEMVQVSASGFFEGEMVVLDNQALFDALLLKADRFSDSLRKAGWSSEEVSEALGFDFRPEKERKLPKKLSPQLVERIGKLAQSVSHS
ncbi:hypothetical protein Ahy_Scaffold1g106912 isoform A [Arachis hypogaea]|uniref:Uncharacterized protein n=1 Tax=Arachis hypogaea TaxID=3818 RepID=A0A444WT85_ARAHY|nr:hypothetical protein Ahy_Scaffold1g106912 isoform A [Arachis hypogaea]